MYLLTNLSFINKGEEEEARRVFRLGQKSCLLVTCLSSPSLDYSGKQDDLAALRNIAW